MTFIPSVIEISKQHAVNFKREREFGRLNNSKDPERRKMLPCHKRNFSSLPEEKQKHFLYVDIVVAIFRLDCKNKNNAKHIFRNVQRDGERGKEAEREENGLLECCQVELSVNFFEIGLMCHFTD
jgi:hypothetical protein